MIRLAKPTDAHSVVPLIIQAMGEVIQKLTSLSQAALAEPLFTTLFQQKGNQYSYEHTWVYEMKGETVGSVTGYDGANLAILRKPVLDLIALHYQTYPSLEEETQAGEFYIDTLSVSADHQGKGIGKALLLEVISWAEKQSYSRVGLLVNHDNPRAKTLYERLGFKVVNNKCFAGGSYDHLVCEVN